MRPCASTSTPIWRVLPSYNSVSQTTSSGSPLATKVKNRNFFSYDNAFGGQSTTEEVYDKTGTHIVSSFCGGVNGTVFAYGQTCSGKTHTMFGSDSSPGIIHLSMSSVFDHISRDDAGKEYLLRASYIEIYNEEVRDLLNGSATLAIREDPKKGVFLASRERSITDFADVQDMIEEGDRNKIVGKTDMNERSSRSHCIFRVTMESRDAAGPNVDENENDNGDNAATNNPPKHVLQSTLNLVDLAGSESVRLTGATGDRQKEGGKINQSLLTLSRVISSLGKCDDFVNYRDSKLTRILQPSLSGNARMSVICCATPDAAYLEETRSTLQFAARAKMVKTRAKVNEVLDDRAVIKKLQKELEEARKLAGGQKAIKHMEKLKRDAKMSDLQAKEALDIVERLKSQIIKGGTLFGKPSSRSLADGSLQYGPGDEMPSLYTPAKAKVKPRRKTCNAATTTTATAVMDNDGDGIVGKEREGEERRIMDRGREFEKLR